MTLNESVRQFTALSSVLCVCDQTAEAIITRFSLYSTTTPPAIRVLRLTTKLTGFPSNLKRDVGLICRV